MVDMNTISFDISESLAIARLVYSLLISDETIGPQESDFFEQLLQNLNIKPAEFESSLSETIENAYKIVKVMPSVKRRECGRFLRMAVNADHSVELSELSRLNEILDKAFILRPDKKTNKKTDEGFS